jgi:hypothetical protein
MPNPGLCRMCGKAALQQRGWSQRIRHSLESPGNGDPGEMHTFIDPDLLDRLRVGPVAPYLDAYLKRIEQEGFLPSSVPI